MRLYIKWQKNDMVSSQGGDTPMLPLIPSATGHHESLTVLLKVHGMCAVINHSRLF